MPNIDDAIGRAMEEGKFDNLSGKGKPLSLDDDALTNPEWRLAHHMLKSAGYSLPWIELRREIESEIDNAVQQLQRAWEWRRAQPAHAAGEAQWQRARRQFELQVEGINRRIADYNLGTPSLRFQMLKIDAGGEIERLQRRP